MFPIHISYKRRLNINDPTSIALAFDYIQGKLEQLKVNKIVRGESRIDFKNGMFNGQGRWHLMAAVDGGMFDYDKTTGTLKYKISTLTGFIFSIGFACLLYLLSKSIIASVLLFLWLYGINWIIAIIRHQKFFNKLIDELQIRIINTTAA